MYRQGQGALVYTIFCCIDFYNIVKIVSRKKAPGEGTIVSGITRKTVQCIVPSSKGLNFVKKIGRRMYTYFFINPCIIRI